jgi:hypothetical protein
VFQMTGCKTCKHNRKRTIRSKNCLKNHRAVFGCNCKDYEKGGEGIGILHRQSLYSKEGS